MRVTDTIQIDESELQEQFVHGSGPGGQHVNKAATTVQLRFVAARSPSLTPDVRQRVLKLAGKRASDDGTILIEAKRYRSRERNRQDARERLAALIRRAAQPPKRRKRTRTPAAAKRRRLQTKRRHAEKKRRRRTPPDELP